MYFRTATTDIRAERIAQPNHSPAVEYARSKRKEPHTINDGMTTMDAIRSRHSARIYTDAAIPEDIRAELEAQVARLHFEIGA